MKDVPLKTEFDHYVAHQNEFCSKHIGEFVVIKGKEVIGFFKDEMEAIRETSKTHTMGTFLVQKCLPGSDSYTSTFHSRVRFA